MSASRHVDRNYVEAIEQIGAERSLDDRFFKIVMCRRNDAHIAVLRNAAADALEYALLQHPQQLHLHGWVHVAYFVEEDRAAVGDFEPPLARCQSTGEGALLVAEQFALEQLGGYGTAVDRHEWACSARRSLVDGARNDFLAGAGFAQNQYVAVEFGDLANQAIDLADGRRLTGRQDRRMGSRRLVQIACVGANENARKGGCFSHEIVVPSETVRNRLIIGLWKKEVFGHTGREHGVAFSLISVF